MQYWWQCDAAQCEWDGLAPQISSIRRGGGCLVQLHASRAWKAFEMVIYSYKPWVAHSHYRAVRYKDMMMTNFLLSINLQNQLSDPSKFTLMESGGGRSQLLRQVSYSSQLTFAPKNSLLASICPHRHEVLTIQP